MNDGPASVGSFFNSLTSQYTEAIERCFPRYREMLATLLEYLPDRSTWDLPTVSPLLAPSVEGVAPAVVATAGFDPLRDEGSAYAERMSDAGVPVWYRCYDDMIHGFFGMGVIPECLGMATEIARATARPLHQI